MRVERGASGFPFLIEVSLLKMASLASCSMCREKVSIDLFSPQSEEVLS